LRLYKTYDLFCSNEHLQFSNGRPEPRGRQSLNDENLLKILTNKRLAQFGDSLLNFAYSIVLTETTGRPKGIKVQDKILADAAARAGLRKLLPRRVGRGEVANSLEALLGHVWLGKMMTLDEIVDLLKKDNLDPSENFSILADTALSKLRQQS
jgi:Ribonuclease III